VSDADKIEALGEVGLNRCFCFTRASNPTLDENQIKSLVVQHAKDKLIKLKDHFIRTPKGKELASAPHEVIGDFIKNNTDGVELNE